MPFLNKFPSIASNLTGGISLIVPIGHTGRAGGGDEEDFAGEYIGCGRDGFSRCVHAWTRWGRGLEIESEVLRRDYSILEIGFDYRLPQVHS